MPPPIASRQWELPAKPSLHGIVVQLTKKVDSIPQVDPRCATDSVGAFQAHCTSTARISSTDAYVATERVVVW